MKVINVFTTNMKIIFARSYVSMKTTCSYLVLKIHVMNYVKSLFINNIDKKDLDEIEVILGFKITKSEKRTFLMNLTKLRRC
jgi:hypothetical protein